MGFDLYINHGYVRVTVAGHMALTAWAHSPCVTHAPSAWLLRHCFRCSGVGFRPAPCAQSNLGRPTLGLKLFFQFQVTTSFFLLNPTVASVFFILGTLAENGHVSYNFGSANIAVNHYHFPFFSFLHLALPYLVWLRLHQCSAVNRSSLIAYGILIAQFAPWGTAE